jgi:predicted ATPase/DNA-binding SARP family transcriptional activator
MGSVMADLSLSLLGTFAATLNQCPITQFRTKSVQALLIYLACEAKRPHPREALMELLWPRMPQASAQANLRQTLYRLRKLIPEVKGQDGHTSVPFLLADRHAIQINPQADYFLDVSVFASSERSQAIALYRGDFLADFYLPDSETFEEWVSGRRADYRRRVLEMMEGETAFHLQRAHYEEAIQLARRQLAMDSLRESSHRQLMEAWARSGRRREALAHYDVLCQLLQAELAVKPEPETLALNEAIRAGDLSRAAPSFISPSPSPLVETEEPKHNLPEPLTPFIGRENEITAVTDLIDRHRLVTLTGVGGIGKTYLCLQVGRKVLEAFPDGVWFIELDRIADPALVAQTAAHTMGLWSVAEVPIMKVMLDYLRAKSSLLIFDNCEHLIEAAAEVGQSVLQACPGVKILASSREALSVPGEMLFQVPPLAVPEQKQLGKFEEWREYEAMRLFVDRARAALPDFQVTPNNIAHLVQICQQLDGIPLALELAAARLKVLSAEQIAARLTDRFRLLTGGSRTALPRQQTLRALIDWSWELLTAAEQRLLARLSVFIGGMSLEALEDVCTGEGLDSDDVLDLLTGLVNKSLVLARREQGKATRYRLLETVRQYAQERLAQSDQLTAFRRRHLNYYCILVEEVKPRLVGPEQVVWIKRLEEELDNIRAALGWAQDTDVESGLRLTSDLYRFWELKYPGEGTSWLAQGLSRSQSIAPEIRAKALLVRGRLGVNTLPPGPVYRLAEESLALYRELEDQKGIASALFLLDRLAAWDKASDRAHPYFQESLALSRVLEDPLMTAEALAWLGAWEAGDRSNYAQAMVHLEESERLLRGLGHLAGIVTVLRVSAQIPIWQGNYALARRKLDECLLQQQQLGQRTSPESLVWLGRLHYWLGEYTQAQAQLENGYSLLQRMGHSAGQPWALAFLGFVCLRRHEFSKALHYFGVSLHAFGETGVAAATGTIFALEGFASLAASQGDAVRATRLFAWADAGRRTWQNVRPTNEQEEVERDMVTIRELIDENVFAAAYAAGQSMTLEEAIAYALEGEKLSSIQ